MGRIFYALVALLVSQATLAHTVAAGAGQHGWYWRNLSDEPATLTLETSGYYTKLGRVEQGGAAAE